ncbi:hypothetical protein TWF594_007990 [Orbilia oligospora]|nr:hypothetical protein TWF594_007990 [Orbilia oligospora]
MSPRCKNLEELDYRQICFYQPADAPEGGVTAAELLKWLEAARSKNRNGYGWSYTVVTKPGENDAEGQKVAAQTQSDTKTCCSSYYNPGRVPQTTDRMWGEQYQADETGLKITIEAVRQAVDYDIENRALCDPEQNLIPVYNAPEEDGEESELPVKEWKDSDPSWTTPPTD